MKMIKSGFTLIELMMVVAIVACLAMVAVPTFTGFLAKAKRTEAYMNLHAIYAAQKAYWAEHGRYSDVLAGSEGIGWRPEGYTGGGSQEKFNYTYGFGHGSEGRNFFTGKLGASHSHLGKAYADANGFMVVAAGNIAGGNEPDIIAIDHNNNIVVLHDALNS